MGWIYALSHDKEYLIETLKLKETYKRNLKQKKDFKPKILIQILIFLSNYTVLAQLKRNGITSKK